MSRQELVILFVGSIIAAVIAGLILDCIQRGR